MRFGVVILMIMTSFDDVHIEWLFVRWMRMHVCAHAVFVVSCTPGLAFWGFRRRLLSNVAGEPRYVYSSRVCVEEKATWSDVPWTAQCFFLCTCSPTCPFRVCRGNEAHQIQYKQVDNSQSGPKPKTTRRVDFQKPFQKGFRVGFLMASDHVATRCCN